MSPNNPFLNFLWLPTSAVVETKNTTEKICVVKIKIKTGFRNGIYRQSPVKTPDIKTSK